MARKYRTNCEADRPFGAYLAPTAHGLTQRRILDIKPGEGNYEADLCNLIQALFVRIDAPAQQRPSTPFVVREFCVDYIDDDATLSLLARLGSWRQRHLVKTWRSQRKIDRHRFVMVEQVCMFDPKHFAGLSQTACGDTLQVIERFPLKPGHAAQQTRGYLVGAELLHAGPSMLTASASAPGASFA